MSDGRRPGESIKDYWARREQGAGAGGGGGLSAQTTGDSKGSAGSRLQPSSRDAAAVSRGRRSAARRDPLGASDSEASGARSARGNRARSRSRERASEISQLVDTEMEEGGGGSRGGRSRGSRVRSSRARSRSRERSKDIEAELAKAEERAAAAKSKRRSRSKDHAGDLEAALQSQSAGVSRGSRSRERALELEAEIQAAEDKARSTLTRSRARSRSRERAAELEKEIQAAEERAAAAKSRRRARSKDRSRDIEKSLSAGVGKDRAAEAFRKRNARSQSRERAMELDAMASDGGGSKSRSSRRGGTDPSADEESRDKFDASSGMRSSKGGTVKQRHGRSALRTTGKSGGTVSSLSDFSASDDDAEGGGGGDPNAPPNLHRDLARANWKSFHSHLQFLARRSDLVMNTVMMTDSNDGGTPLHTAVWKAPPQLALMLIRLLPTSKELSGIFTTKDKDANTALHLCCANLELTAAEEEDEDSGGSSGGGGGGEINTSVLEALARAAPRAVSMQNSEGDSPLHMLVSSPACAAANLEGNPEASAAAERAVKLLLDAGPGGGRDALLLQDMTGATPLHVAVASRASEGVILALLKSAAPDACRTDDNRGMLPLHYVAAFCHTPPSAVRRIIESYPEGVVHHTHNGDTPLHLCISNASSAEGAQGAAERGRLDKTMGRIVEMLMGPDDPQEGGGGGKSSVGACPLLMTNREKLTPLHCCALFDAPPQLTRLLMKHPAAKRAASMTNSFGATPLHLAAAQPGVAQSIATVVAIGTPEAAAVQDRLKRTPLHVAAQNIHATAQLIKALADLNPDATAEKTQRGHLPLHLAAQSQAKEPVIKALIKAFPKATEAKNKSSNTPLHDAAKYRASAGVVKLLLDTYPEAVYIQNQYGNLPLHCATAYQAPGDVVQLLLSKWPDGASMQNRNQDAPLHYAAAYATSADAVRPLIDAAPAAVLLLNSSGQSPIDRARANNAPDEIIELLERSARDWSNRAGGGDGWGAFPPGDNSGFDNNAGFNSQY
mmetsp:Transcript_47827/g.144646  ORF Transcript_47827/g.144646 Transcript_47827/m.144646 type:complete len:1013 (-) Transcript_47827:248-3286(-)